MCLEAWGCPGKGCGHFGAFSPLLSSNFSGQSWTERWWGGRARGGVQWGRQENKGSLHPAVNHLRTDRLEEHPG